MSEFERLTFNDTSTCAISTWKIQSFSQLREGEYLVTPSVKCHNDTWNLYLRLNSEYPERNKIEIFLELKGKDTLPDDIEITIGLNTVDNVIHETENRSIIYKGNPPKCGYFCTVGRETLLGEMRDCLLPCDTLTVVCEITKFSVISVLGVAMRISEWSDKVEIPSTSSHQTALSRDLKQMVSNPELCDVILSAGGKDFPAIKSILALRSPVFLSMFQEEKPIKTVINIPDIDAETMDHMINYICSGETRELSKDTAINLFVAALKYGLLELKEYCIQFLETVMSPENFWEIALLADKHSDETLKASVKSFLMRNPSRFFATDEWKTVLEERPQLASEALLAVAAYFYPEKYNR